MLISLCRVTAGGGLDWPAFVALASRAGYDAVDIDMEPARRDGASATRDLLARHKLKPAVCSLPVEFRTDDAAFDEGMRDLDAYARLAADLGCARMATWVPPAFDKPGDPMRAILKRRFTEIAQVLAAHHVRLA